MASHFGRGIHIKGELTSTEDVLVEGILEGKVSVPGHTLTIAKEGRADVNALAKRIVVVGTVKGILVASEMIEILSTAVVSGDVSAPRLMLEEGASVHATLDTKRSDAAIAVARYRHAEAAGLKK